ncbi:hypothetical protein [Qiania dongpingensis]|uniref:Uncharacterized protein n=1 Tax=Qiania dongpingensis TaxID=2763669 RepID=A0A7G9G2V7_9FIRM|nr:hypothetical protein [Qiania dongpingensis]QNM05139.1 hypothetical protein H9Q78_11915 [Qiania dongpingensis]
MMLAVLCDDQAADRELLLEFCTRYGKEKGLPVSTLAFEKPGRECVYHHREHYADGFEVEAIHYLLKPVAWDSFREAMTMSFCIYVV